MEPIDLTEYERINKANWDSRVQHHEQGYGLASFTDDPTRMVAAIRAAS